VGAGGEVKLWFSRRNESLEISIEDNGPGISPDLQEKIFEPFFTTKSQGTGLGLAIVARRVSEMGGEIRWRSPLSDGRGAQFSVVLPIVGSPTKLVEEKGVRR
jgi:two-component system, sensor histidine kinase FlrB